MPKFLDVPSWYGSDGSELKAWTEPGSSGQVLTSGGENVLPTWTTMGVKLWQASLGITYASSGYYPNALIYFLFFVSESFSVPTSATNFLSFLYRLGANSSGSSLEVGCIPAAGYYRPKSDNSEDAEITRITFPSNDEGTNLRVYYIGGSVNYNPNSHQLGTYRYRIYSV